MTNDARRRNPAAGEPGEPGGAATPERAAEIAPEAAGEADSAILATPSADEIGDLRRELAERNDQFLRLAADFENFRRRKAQETADRARYASEDAALALLPVLDNLRRAVEHAPEPGDDPQLQSGLRMVLVQFETALAAIGVERITTVGSVFDPAVHQAIGGEESDEVTEDTVAAEVQAGYRLHDRLLRPALVRVVHPRVVLGGAPPPAR